MALCRHDPSKGLARQHGAENIQFEHPAQSVGGEIEEIHFVAGGGGWLVSSRAVDQAVDFAQAVYHVLSCLGNAVAVEHVAAEKRELFPAWPHALHQLF